MDPAFRGHGVAATLLTELEDRARAAGAAVFAFHTSAFMTTAVALYERLGYCRAPRFDIDVNAHYGVHRRPSLACSGLPAPLGVSACCPQRRLIHAHLLGVSA